MQRRSDRYTRTLSPFSLGLHGYHPTQRPGIPLTNIVQQFQPCCFQGCAGLSDAVNQPLRPLLGVPRVKTCSPAISVIADVR